MKKLFYILSVFLVVLGCDSDEENLPSADERRQTAIDDLKDKLTAPENGWVLYYQPNDDSGTYYILLDFDDEEVRIQSDVTALDGILRDQTIPYRVDVQLAVQLTFETFAVFHYLFEQEQYTFGAEFEFFYLDELDDGTLRLYSKTDPADNPTVISLEPAAANAADFLSPELSENYNEYRVFSQPIGEQNFQQLYLTDLDISVFWTADFMGRNFILDGANAGKESNGFSSDSWVNINQSVGYTFFNDQLILDDEISFTVNGANVIIPEIVLNDFDLTGTAYCGGENTPVYSGNIDGVGGVELNYSLFNSGGLDFTLEPDEDYGVNVFFVADSSGFSFTSDNLIIGQLYPDATGFVMNYGRDSSEIAYSIGIAYQDENDFTQTHLRGYDMTAVEGNFIQINLNETFNYTNANEVTVEDEQNLREMTNEVIGSGEFYISNFDQDELTVFRLYNPCNGNEFALVKP